MRWHYVEVVESPQIKSLAITVHPPAYTGLPPTEAERHLDVLAGTGIEVGGAATKPLRAARIRIEGEPLIEATIASDDAGNKSQAFRIEPKHWLAKKTGEYSLEFVGDDGLAATVGQWKIRVEPDSPPTVVWQSPSEDLYVMPNALIPIELVVKDNLAIKRVALKYERSDWSEPERERAEQAARIELYKGPEKAPPPSRTSNDPPGEKRIVEYSWDLAPLELPVGTVISLEAGASDYRSGVGRTTTPRRITIITPDELDERLAKRQAQIVRQLERALAVQQTTREDVRRVEIQQQSGGKLGSGDRNTLRSAELNQRRVGRMLVDPAEGVPAMIESMLSEVKINRAESSEVRDAVDRLAAELQRLADGSLNVAEAELTAVKKSLDVSNDESPDVSRPLTTAGAAQDDVVSTLEKLIGELSSRVDYRRFTRLLTELRKDQLAHAEAVRQEVRVDTLMLRVNELTRAQRAVLQRAALGQNALAARLEKIEQGMDQMARESSDRQSEVADVLNEAVELARSLAIASKMHETAADLSENRVSGALDRQQQSAADLQHVIDVLRGQQQSPEQSIAKLRDAQQQLARLLQQLSDLRNKIGQAEHQPAQANPEQLKALNEQQQEARREIEKLARQLDRLAASDAAQSTQNAANRLDNQEQSENRPSPSNEVQKSEQDLKQAEQQLAQQRQQAEEDLALEIVRRFQQQLTEMVERQREVIDATIKVDTSRIPDRPLAQAGVAELEKLAAQERELADMANEHSELLVGLGAVRVSLEDAERRLAAAATLLDQHQSGGPAQQAERHALARLEGMMEAFAQTANEAAPREQPQQPPGGAGNQPNQPQRRPTFELLEVKMLRMLQVDLQERTQEHQRLVASLKGLLDPAQQAALQKEAQELSAEQGRLAELVQNMLSRDNEQQE
jgi:hypothetical protein